MSNPNPQNQFKPGQSGNPNGRPKSGWTMRDEYIKALERQTADGTPMKQGVSEALVDRALEGDVLAIKEVNNRIDGQSRQSQDITSNGETIQGNSIVLTNFRQVDAAKGK